MPDAPDPTFETPTEAAVETARRALEDAPVQEMPGVQLPKGATLVGLAAAASEKVEMARGLANTAAMIETVSARAETARSIGAMASIPIHELGPLGVVGAVVTAGTFGQLAALADTKSGLLGSIGATEKFGLLGAAAEAVRAGQTSHFGSIAAAQLEGIKALGTIGSGLKLDALGLGSGASTFAKIGVADPLVADWRAKLVGATGPVQASVAGAMGQAIAADRVRFFGGFDSAELIRKTIERNQVELGAQSGVLSMLDQIQRAFEPITRDLQERILKGIRPVTLLAAQGLTAEFASANKREREYREALWHMGWWFPPSMSMTTFWRIGKMAAEGDRFGVQRAMNELSHSDEYLRHAKREWFELPVFHDRARFLLDGFEDHRRGRYRVSIPTLLPHLEGIAFAAFAPQSTGQNPRPVLEDAVDDTDALMGDALVDAVTVLWARHDFSQVRAGQRTLNRQLILHGRTTGWPRNANSTKILFAFDLLATFVEADQQVRAKRDKKAP